MSDSALQDQLLAERRRIRAAWQTQRKSVIANPVVPNIKFVDELPVQPEKTVAERIAEAKKLQGSVSATALHRILNSIYESAEDCGDESLYRIFECEPEPVLPGIPSIVNIQSAVAEHFGLTTTKMISKRRRKGVTLPCQIAMYLSRKLTMLPHSEISRRFDNRDHTTVVHATRKITNLVDTDIVLAKEINTLREALAEEVAGLKRMLEP